MRLTLTAIIGLFLWGCPAAVAGFVVFISVDPVKAHPSRAVAHISEKGFKIVSPVIADSDPAPAVIFEAPIVVWSVASGFHSNPRTIDAGPEIPMLVAVSLPVDAADFALKTSTTRRASSCYVPAVDDGFHAAVALSDPVRAPPGYMRKAQYGEATETQAGEVFDIRHALNHSMKWNCRQGPKP
jgi:hypothetical protein